MARVSSDEQAKGYSLDIQTEKLIAHCQKEDISIINIFKEDCSAKNFNRPEFKKMLQYLSKNKGKVCSHSKELYLFNDDFPTQLLFLIWYSKFNFEGSP